MGFMDDILAQQGGGGMLGGLPASWQYQNPESLTPEQKQMMALVGKDGFNLSPVAAPIAGMLSQDTQAPTAAPMLGAPPSPPISTDNSAPPAAPTVAPAAPTFGAGGSPLQFPQSQSLFGGNVPPAAAPVFAKQPPVVAADDGEEDAPAANPATAPASPIGVGNVQMPRIGPAAAFTPSANANAQAPVQSAPVAAPSIGDKLMTGYQNLHHGGGLIGSIVASITGKRNDPAGVALDQQSQVANITAQALINRGVPRDAAIAAVQPGNGEALKTLWNQAFTQGAYTQETDKDGNVWNVNKQTGQKTVALQAKDDKFQHVEVKNPDGTVTLRSFNAKTGEYDAPPPVTALKSAVDPNSTGQERMDQLKASDPNYARKIQAMVDGDIPMPTSGQAARSPQAQRMIEDALAVSGSTSASDFATRAATRKDYASGIASRVTKSINTTIGHFATLDNTIDKLGNYTYFPSVSNYLHDKVASNTDPEYQKAKATFETNKEAAIKELDFALSGGHSSVSGSAEIRGKFDRADSPAALHAAVTEAMSLLEKRLQSHTKGFNEGTKSQRDEQDFLYPENRVAFNKLMGSQDTSTGKAVPGVSEAAPTAIPTLKVGQSTTINGVPIKKVAD